MAGTIFLLILLPIWAFGFGIFLDLTTTGKTSKTSSDQIADSAAGLVGTIGWFVQIALMALSTRLSWLTPLVSLPASVFFYFLGCQVSEERRKQFDIVPFFETFTILDVTPEERKSRLRKLRSLLMLGVGGYALLIGLLALFRHNEWIP